jgi:rod shape-determining protein MreC
VHKDCVVVDGNGLIGKVTETGDGWSKVVSVLSDGNNISFRVLRDQTITGVVSGDGETHLDGYVIEEKMRIIKGDQLVTTGVGLYPAGILIGTVDTVEYDDDRQMKVITVSPTANFEGLQKVAVFL